MQFQQNEGEAKGIPGRVGTEAGRVQCRGSASTGFLLEASREVRLKVTQGSITKDLAVRLRS